MTRALLPLVLVLAGCLTTRHPHVPAALGQPSRAGALLAVVDTPGPLTVETVSSAAWVVDRSGVIDLHDARAKAAGLRDGEEPIEVFFHVIRHPTRGTFIVDTGMERALRDAPERAALRGLVTRFMKRDQLHIHVALGDWLAAHGGHLDGVLLTHLHLDHVAGLPDVPRGTPIYAGPHEADARSVMSLFVQASLDRALAGHAPLAEWQFAPDPDGRFAGVIDVFGDGSLWAIATPGHTTGATAYLARTTRGPVLLTGDTCHTTWGWQHQVAPGSFSVDRKANADSLARLERLVAEHPTIDVRLGHQRLPGQ
jgi:N-acyl homoserine lactone hydrolase